MSNIEIGISVVTKIYPHWYDDHTEVEIETKAINEINQGEEGTYIHYGAGFLCIAEESEEEIKEAIKEAEAYRNSALDAINSMLKTE